jgi:arylsulfatase A-like enzyme
MRPAARSFRPTPRRLLAAALLALTAFAAGCGERGADSPPAPRRIFLVTVDTLRADHMSLYGYPRQTSPRVDELARGGVRFDAAVAQWPKTGASFASLFTGLYPQSSGLVQKAALRIPERYRLLPEVLREEGWTTVAVVSNAVLGARLGWDRGFDEYLETWGGGDLPEDPHAFRPLAQAPRVNELARPLLARHAAAEKLFVWIHYTDPHAPYVLPAGESNPFLDDGLVRREAVVPARVRRGYRVEERTDLDFYVAQYDANVRVADRHAGELLAHARELGLLASSLVVFTADHGESLGEHDSWFEHGPLPYNTTARVPLVIAGEGIPPGAVSAPVELIDLYPTLLALVAPGREVPGLEGRSLLPWLVPRDGTTGAASRLAFSEAGERPRYFRSVQDGGWKLVQGFGGRGRRRAGGGTFELYDLAADPLETRDLAAQRPEEVRRLRGELLRWAKAGEQRRPPDAGAADEHERQALEALGYAN